MAGKKHSKTAKSKKGVSAGTSDRQASLDRMLKLVDEGDLRGAEVLCARLLEEQPENARVLHLLGVLRFQRGNHASAIRHMEKALELTPRSATFHCSLGNVWEAVGNMEKAVHHYREALFLNPDHLEVLQKLGGVLKRMGKLREAVDILRRAVNVAPTTPSTHNDLGLALMELGDMKGAQAAYRKATEVDESFCPALNNLGYLCWKMGEAHGAVRYLSKALELSPGSAPILLNLGNAYVGVGLIADAEELYLKAIQIDPLLSEPYNSLSALLISRGELGRAVTACRKALALDPNHTSARANLVETLVRAGQCDEAMGLMRETLHKGGHEPSLLSNYLLMLHYDASQSPQSIWEEHRKLGLRRVRLIREKYEEKPFVRPEQKEGGRLRVGYVSPDFKGHSVAYFADPLLEGHDRQKFEVVCYSNTAQEDDWTQRFRGHADEWYKVVGFGDGELTQKIREDRIDILVDLAGHTAGNCMGVFARRAAPIQVTYLGYPNTTGLDTMDYRLTDHWADPEGMTEHLHTEKLIRLPRGFHCYRPPSDSPRVQSPPCLGRGYVTFGSFNNRSKINEKVLDAWAAILKGVPHSRMLIKSLVFADEDTRATLLRLFRKRGIGEDRIQLMGKIPSVREHLALYNQVDIALDTFPYHGTTTTCEALWMGVPVISLAGKSHVSRVGVSLLSQVGLQDVIVHTQEDYVRKALALARNTGELERWRTTLRNVMQTSSLMDARGFARDVEAAYLEMWENLDRDIESKVPQGNPGIEIQTRWERPDDARSMGSGSSMAPSNPHAVYSLGVIAGKKGDWTRAEELLQQAIKLGEEQSLDALKLSVYYNALGFVLFSMNEFRRALSAYEKVLELTPRNHETLYNVGSLHLELENHQEAVECFQKAVEIHENYPKAYDNLAVALLRQSRFTEALEQCSRAIERDPAFANAYNNRGLIFHRLQQFDKAVGDLSRAVAINPSHFQAHANLAESLAATGKVSKALDHLYKAVGLNPGYSMGHGNLGVVLAIAGRISESIQSHRKALEIDPAYKEAHSSLLMTLKYAFMEPEEVFEEHCRWWRAHGSVLGFSPGSLTAAQEVMPSGRLRVGYLSPNFHFHSVAYFMEPLLAHHDRERFEVVCYCDAARNDEMTARLRSHGDEWHQVMHMTDENLANRVREDGIHILVDLAGHTANNRMSVFARKPAPVQVSYLGYPDTTGLETMDYRFTDRWADPEGQTEHLHTEKLIRLPRGFLCYQPPRGGSSSDAASLPRPRICDLRVLQQSLENQ